MVKGSRAPILIVDDDPDVRLALQQVLESAGYATIRAADGREALDVVMKQKPALVLLDLMMPVMDGWEFLRERQTHPETATVPVVIISAVMKASRQVPTDVDGYLPKPFGADELLKMVSGLYKE